MDKYILTSKDEFINYCGQTDLSSIALDFECKNITVPNLDVAGWSLCNGQSTAYVDILDNAEKESMIWVLRQLLKNVTTTLIMHNAPFDMRMLYQLNVPHTTNIFCTMTAAHLLNENEPKGLKWQTEHVLGVIREVVSFEDAKSDGWHSTKFYTYATEDAEDTWLLYKRQVPRLHGQKLWDLWYNIERPFQYCLRELATNGVFIDKEKLLTAQAELAEEVYNLAIRMYESANIPYYIQINLFGEQEVIPSVNLDSPKQLVELITNKLKVKLPVEDGKISTKAAVLEGVKHAHPFLELLVEYRSMNKLLNSFLNTLPNFIEEDGRIYGNFHNTVAVTGRLSCSKPPLQCLPKG